jgi:hypothetical protein
MRRFGVAQPRAFVVMTPGRMYLSSALPSAPGDKKAPLMSR